jgi:hypothetical protein
MGVYLNNTHHLMLEGNLFRRKKIFWDHFPREALGREHYMVILTLGSDYANFFFFFCPNNNSDPNNKNVEKKA